ncbi:MULTISPECIES: hypothetical protein [Arthrobacter]|uniref:Uncharacterized protein n=1 Tax=Arthrobacter terricola TaxID=2547396 RepID=A0A4R5KE97_9MICC|nr:MULTISPECIES: hypothetical protein [Arthrobacter]TDF92460.1 hypothetical protein E1809_18160 [Arthrobacter terricola]
MRKNFILSWPQAVGFLFIAGTIIFRPEFDPWRIAVGGLLVILVAVGIGVKLHYERIDRTTKGMQDEQSGAGEDVR